MLGTLCKLVKTCCYCEMYFTTVIFDHRESIIFIRIVKFVKNLLESYWTRHWPQRQYRIKKIRKKPIPQEQPNKNKEMKLQTWFYWVSSWFVCFCIFVLWFFLSFFLSFTLWFYILLFAALLTGSTGRLYLLIKHFYVYDTCFSIKKALSYQIVILKVVGSNTIWKILWTEHPGEVFLKRNVIFNEVCCTNIL